MSERVTDSTAKFADNFSKRMNIAEIVLWQGEWPLSDDCNPSQAVCAREEAKLVEGFISQAIQCAISDYPNPKISFGEMREQLHAMCCEEVPDRVFYMTAWAMAAQELLKTHRPSSRQITWLLSDVAANVANERACSMFVKHFATFSKLDLDYLMGYNYVDANIVLLVWTERARRPFPVAENDICKIDIPSKWTRIIEELSRRFVHFFKECCLMVICEP